MSADVIKLQDENNALKDQVKRLIKELSTCQETLGIKSSSSDSHSFEFEIHDESFDCGTIAPLFTAYDHRIKELSSFIDRQGSVLDLLTQRSTDLLSENENLRKRIIQGLPNKNNDIKKECENDQLKVTNVKNLLSDNSLLEEQATLLVKELNDAHVVIRCRDETISSLTDQVRSKLKLIHNLNDKVQLLIKEKGICETELASQIKEITTQKNYIDDLKDCVDKLNREQSQMSSQVDQTGIDKCCLETENEALTMNMTQSGILIQELRHQLSTSSSDFMELNEKQLAMQKVLEGAKSELEHLRQSNTALTLQLNLAKKTETELQSLQRETSSNMKETELARDKALAISSSLENEVNHLLFHSKGDGKHADVANRWSNASCQEIKRRDQLIHSLKLLNNELNIQTDKSSRENELIKASRDHVENCLQKERMATKFEIESLQNQLSDIAAKLTIEQSQKSELIQIKSMLQQEITSLKDSLNVKKSELNHLQVNEKRKNQEYSETRLHLQRKIDDLQGMLKIETSKLQQEKESLSMEIEEMKLDQETNIEILRCKNRQLEQSLKDISKSNKVLREEIRSIVERNKKTQHEFETQFQNKLNECQESLKAQLKENKELLSNNRAVGEDKLNLEFLIRTKTHDIDQISRKLLVSEEKVSQLSVQLHDCLSDQHDKLSQIKDLKMVLQGEKMKNVKS